MREKKIEGHDPSGVGVVIPDPIEEKGLQCLELEQLSFFEGVVQA